MASEALIRASVFIDRGWNRDNISVAIRKALQIIRKRQMRGLVKLLRGHFKRYILALSELCDPRRVYVKPHNRTGLTKFNSEGKANVAKPNNRYFQIIN
jgi:hypothetical protein